MSKWKIECKPGHIDKGRLYYFIYKEAGLWGWDYVACHLTEQDARAFIKDLEALESQKKVIYID